MWPTSNVGYWILVAVPWLLLFRTTIFPGSVLFTGSERVVASGHGQGIRDHHFLVVGDWGVGGSEKWGSEHAAMVHSQRVVADGMERWAAARGRPAYVVSTGATIFTQASLNTEVNSPRLTQVTRPIQQVYQGQTTADSASGAFPYSASGQTTADYSSVTTTDH
jgi:hypothetical protein